MSVTNYSQGLADGTIKLKSEEARKPSVTEKYAQSAKVKAKSGAAVQQSMPPKQRRERAPWQSETEQSE